MPGGREKVKTRRGWGALGGWGWDRVLLGKTVKKRERQKGKKDVSIFCSI